MLSETALVAEISCRSIFCLAAQYGIDVAPRNFVHPKIERERLELKLVRRGVELGGQVRASEGAGLVLELGDGDRANR